MVDWEDVFLGGGVALGVILGYKYRQDLKEEFDQLLRRVRSLEAERRKEEEKKKVESVI